MIELQDLTKGNILINPHHVVYLHKTETGYAMSMVNGVIITSTGSYEEMKKSITRFVTKTS